MGRTILVARLAACDLRRRWSETVLLLLAIVAAMGTLTLGLVLHGVTNGPYTQTRAATAGPDVVASSTFDTHGRTSPADLHALVALAHSKGVAASSGPYPFTTAILRTATVTAGADVEGRDLGSAAVDQPLVTDGSWVRPGGVVVERTFADATGLQLGDRVTLNDRTFRVVGFAVTAAFSPFPQIGCRAGCSFGSIHLDSTDTGLVWTTRAAAASLATAAAPLMYVSNLKLANPAAANAFGGTVASTIPSSTFPFLEPWQQISYEDSTLVLNEQTVILVGSWLLAILAVASVAVLVGGRMADQMRRVGLLKAIGGTPGLVAAVLMAEYLTLSVAGAALGLGAGWLFAPVLTAPGAGLLGAAPTVPMTGWTILVVMAVALGVAVLAALVPALRSARTSTVRALADAAPATAFECHGGALPSPAGPAPHRLADHGAAVTTHDAQRLQRLRHRVRHRRCAHSAHCAERIADRRGFGAHRPAHPTSKSGAARPHRGAVHARGRERRLHHSGDYTGRQARVGGDPRPRRHTTPGRGRAVGGAGSAGVPRCPARYPRRLSPL